MILTWQECQRLEDAQLRAVPELNNEASVKEPGVTVPRR